MSSQHDEGAARAWSGHDAPPTLLHSSANTDGGLFHLSLLGTLYTASLGCTIFILRTDAKTVADLAAENWNHHFGRTGLRRWHARTSWVKAMRYASRRPIVAALLAVVAAAGQAFAAEGVTGAHALSMFDDVKYGRDFEHFDYANPSAPTGGNIRLAALGTFDSLNPFILKGNPAAGSDLIYDTLPTGSLDEPFTDPRARCPAVTRLTRRRTSCSAQRMSGIVGRGGGFRTAAGSWNSIFMANSCSTDERMQI